MVRNFPALRRLNPGPLTDAGIGELFSCTPHADKLHCRRSALLMK
jgi:hypothetical protein